MEERKLTCITCPQGCCLTISLEADKIVNISGNTCKRGETYAKKELTNPTRIVTTTVPVEDGIVPRVSIKTETDIPKGKIKECLAQLKGVTVKAPIFIGDVILANVANTGVDMVATRKVEHIRRIP